MRFLVGISLFFLGGREGGGGERVQRCGWVGGWIGLQVSFWISVSVDMTMRRMMEIVHVLDRVYSQICFIWVGFGGFAYKMPQLKRASRPTLRFLDLISSRKSQGSGSSRTKASWNRLMYA